MRRFSACFLAFSFLLGISGCSCDQQPPAPLTPTPAQVFDKTHGGKTNTTYGDVLAGTAQDISDGTIQYQTSDQKWWKVDLSNNGTYGIPVRLERPITTEEMAPAPGQITRAEAVVIVSEIVAGKEQDPSILILGGATFAVPPAAVEHLTGLPAGTLLKVAPVLLATWGRAEVPPGFVDECGPAAVPTEKRVVITVTNGKETTARTYMARRHTCVYYADDPPN